MADLEVREPLINDETDTIAEKINSDYQSKTCCNKVAGIFRSITVEPVIIGSIYVIDMYWMMAKEYVYYRTAQDHNLTGTGKQVTCNDSNSNKSDAEHELENKVASEASRWFLYLATTNFAIGVFATLLLGSWSDKVGRKIPMIISHLGINVLVLTYVLVVYFSWPIQILLIGHFLCGLSGDFGCVMTCCLAYVSENAKREDRTFRMAIIGACLGVGGFLSGISGGVWVNKQGFLYPFCFLYLICIITEIYVCLRIKSTHSDTWLRSLRALFTKEPFVHIYAVIRPQPENKRRHLHILAFVTCYLLMFTTYAGVREIIVVYELSQPFCMSALLVGISMALTQVGFFVSMIMVKVFPGVTTELKLVILGVISNISASIVIAVATTTWMIFFGLSLQVFNNLPAPILRSQASRIVSDHEVGSLFSMLSFANNLGNLFSPLFFDGVYSFTVQTSFPGSAFFISVGLTLLFMPLYWWVFYQTKEMLLENNTPQQDKE